MSVTLAPKESSEQPENQVDPEAVFEDLLADRDVCARCFRVIRSGARRVQWGAAGHDKVDHDRYGVIASYPERTVCEGCGTIASNDAGAPMDRRSAVQAAGRLALRLRENGHDVDMDLVKYAVKHLKSTEEYAGRDRVCFEVATRVAVRRSR